MIEGVAEDGTIEAIRIADAPGLRSRRAMARRARCAHTATRLTAPCSSIREDAKPRKEHGVGGTPPSDRRELGASAPEAISIAQ